MDLLKSMHVSAAGLQAQSTRLKVISENLANADSTAKAAGGDPYRRKVVTFRSELDRSVGAELVKVGRVGNDRAEFELKFDPSHPAADAKGYVKQPNVNALIELTDMREAQRTYEANLAAIEAARAMLAKTVDLLR